MKRYLSVGEMAELHNISRQTLIYYDKIGLFNPIHVDENGYRHYSPYQIPFLREICFLKSVGIKLEDIKNHIKNRNLSTAISLLEYHKEFIGTQIQKLLSVKESIESRLHIYQYARQSKEELFQPVIEEFPTRKVVFLPLKSPIQKQDLHLAIMQAWTALSRHGILPSAGFGTMIRQNSIDGPSPLEGAGAFVTLSVNDPEVENMLTLPPGKYACMFKYGMPYDTKALSNFLKWINAHGFRVAGDILDMCILDTTFYNNSTDVDFCQLQIPVEINY